MQTKLFTTTVETAITEAFSEFENLASELRDWYDNMPENFQNAEKGSEVCEAADAMENIQEPEQPELSEEVLSMEIAFRPAKRRPSRSDRRDEACEMLAAAVDVLRAANDSAIEEYANELERLKEEAEQVEFPGAY